MIDYTANTVESTGFWSWKSEAGGAAPAPSSPAIFEFAHWFGETMGLGWSWLSESGGAVVPSGADDYIVRARRRGRR